MTSLTFLSPEIAVSSFHIFPFYCHELWYLVHLGTVMSVFTSIPQYGYLTLWLVSGDFSTWSFQCSVSHFTPVSFQMIKCSENGMLIWCLFLLLLILFLYTVRYSNSTFRSVILALSDDFLYITYTMEILLSGPPFPPI